MKQHSTKLKKFYTLLGLRSFGTLKSIVSISLFTLLLATTLACGGGGGSSPVAPTVLHITLANGEEVKSDGNGLFPEVIEGASTPVLLGTLGDNKNDGTGEVSYALADSDDDTDDDNNLFEIVAGEIAGEQILQFKGNATHTGDYENAPKTQFTLKIERYNNEDDATNKRNPQIFKYVINLENLNDNAPTHLIGYTGETTDAIDEFKAMGDVSGGQFAMVLKGVEDDAFTIEFVKRATIDIWQNLRVTPQYDDANDNTKVTGFEIEVGSVGVDFARGLTEPDPDTINDVSENRRQDDADFTVWDEYVKSVTYNGIGSQPISNDGGYADFKDGVVAAGPVTLVGRGVIEVVAGTDGIIANYPSTDADGDLLTYSLSGADADAFTIDENGNLRFKDAPNFASPADANGDNNYEVSVTVSDGLPAHNDTYDLLVVVADM